MRIREDVGAVWSLDQARIFDSSGPLAGVLGVLGREEYRRRETVEVKAVGAGSEAKARGVHPDLHGAGIVFGTVENEDFSVADDGGGIEGVEGLPVGRLGKKRIGEGRSCVGKDDGSGNWAGKRT